MAKQRERPAGIDLQNRVESIIQEVKSVSIREFSQRRRQMREHASLASRCDDSLLAQVETLAECRGTRKAIADLLGLSTTTFYEAVDENNPHCIHELRDAMWRGRAILYFRNAAKQVSEALRGNTRMLEYLGDSMLPHAAVHKELEEDKGKTKSEFEIVKGFIKDLLGKEPSFDPLPSADEDGQDSTESGMESGEFEH